MLRPRLLGSLKTGDTVLNPRTGKTDRIGRLVKMHADKREDVTEILAGDICACLGVKHLKTGDTLCDPHHPIALGAITFPAATAHGRATMVDVIERAADQCFMPLTVGGGIKSVDDMYTMLRAGADKISINSSALANPDLIRAGAEKFGSQCIVVSIDAKKVAPDKWEVFSHGARKPTGLDAVEWAKRAVSLGSGEIVLNSIDTDGTKAGFDLVITRRISESVGVPVVASGGAGSLEHMAEVLLEGKADAVLAASIFHFGTYTVGDVKHFLAEKKIPVRL